MGKYDDILYLEHPVSKNHKQMSIYDRSAQFAPFAALVGYDESIEEAGKIYESQITISDDKIEEIGRIISYIVSIIEEKPRVKITYFKALKNKNQGKYIDVVDRVIKVDELNHLLYLEKDKIRMSDINDIELM